MTTLQPHLTVADVQARLKVGRATVYRLIYAGELKSMKVGRVRRIPVSELEAYEKRQMKKAS